MDNNPVEKRTQGLVARAQSVILKPAETFPKIATESDPPMSVFTSYVVPLVAIGPIASFIGGQLFGYGGFGFSYRPSLMGGLSTAIISYILGLIGVWVLAWIANFLSPKFGGKDDFPAAFRLVAYSMTAAWVVGIIGLIPALGILGLAGLYSFYLYYKGATPVMGVPQDKAVGYTAVTVVSAVVLYIVVGAVTASIAGLGALAGGGLAAADAQNDRATIDLGEYGRIETGKDGAVAEMKFRDPETGEEMTVTVNESEE